MTLHDDELRRLASALPDDGELPYPPRREIRLALAELGHGHVVRLGEQCARRVAPLWTAAFPDDAEPVEVLDDALAGRDVQNRLGALRTKLDAVYAPEPPFGPAFAAGMACWAVANEAAAGEVTEIEAEDEREFDPDYWPPCFFAAAAEAGGATWEESGDAVRRAAFWRWYLLEAVPAARDLS
ncbi:Imm5 family immunity protein [Lentzea sp. NPDC058450]|uniref:Imm5 family immunity protein n=1 Tax=Lentzea sp. NPDC058450 TaxID=3346505 RepID=UPI003656DB4B